MNRSGLTSSRKGVPLLGADHVVRGRDQFREGARFGGVTERSERSNDSHGFLQQGRFIRLKGSEKGTIAVLAKAEIRSSHRGRFSVRREIRVAFSRVL